MNELVDKYILENKNSKLFDLAFKYESEIDLNKIALHFVDIKSSYDICELLSLEADRVEKEQRIVSELGVATGIQYSVLPHELQDDNKDNVFGLMDSAKEVGGDLYDYFYIDEVHLALVIADVSGKGIPAALFMMKTEALIKSLTISFKSDTASIMKRINIALCSNNDESIFVTCWLGIVNLASGELKYTNAGHNKVIIMHEGKPEYTTDKPGVVLGAFEGTDYVENTVRLSQNDKIILYTDGVTEAHNLNNELYGEKRLLKFAQINNGLCPKDFVVKLRKDVEQYSNGAPQFDDITILAFKYVNENKIQESRIFDADVKELDKFILKGQLNKALHIIAKDRFGAFQTDFYNMFYKPYRTGYDEIHICGLVTDICVISNALILKSTFPWIKIVVHENCCGGTSKEAHDAAILVMKSCQIDIE